MHKHDDILGIGELAKRAKISVRALRHYEAIGLLLPKRNPDNNRRRYSRAEVAQVMKITTLKKAGLDLHTIGKALSGGVDVQTLVSMQIRQLQVQHDKTKAALSVLQKAARYLNDHQDLNVDLLCQIMRSTTVSQYPDENVFKDYFDKDQIQKIKNRGTSPQELANYGQQWSDLIARVQKLTDAGTPADSDEALQCAREWTALVQRFTQNDPGITKSLTSMYADKDAWKDRAQMPFGQAVSDYIAEAQGALLERGEG